MAWPALLMTINARLFSEQGALAPFFLVLDPGFFDGLPLHIGRRVAPTGAERDHMVNHVAMARPALGPICWARVLALELGAGSVAPCCGVGLDVRDQHDRHHKPGKW